MSDYEDSDEDYLYYQDDQDDEAWVTIRTEDNSWSKEVSVDNVLLADIIRPYSDIGEVPAEIVLSGTIAEIFRDQWPAYEEYQAYRSWVIKNGKGNETSDMESMLRGKEVLMKGSIPKVVALHRISAISGILNMESDWRLYVAATSSSSFDDTKRHLKSVRDVLNQTYGSYSGRYDDDFFIVPVLRDVVDYMERKRGGSYAYGLVHAAMRNAMLLAMMRGGRERIEWEDIAWLPLHVLLGEVLPEEPWSLVVLNTVATFFGAGEWGREVVATYDYDYISDRRVHYRKRPNARVPYRLREDDINTRVAHITKLYEVIVSSIPDTIDPELYGLGPIIRRKFEPLPKMPNELAYSIVSWLNYNSITFYAAETDTPITNKSFFVIVRLLRSTVVGTFGMKKMKAILTHYLKTHQSKRAEAFIAEIDKVIDGPLGERPLPASKMLQRAHEF